jgi:hypothetical protein
MLFSSVGGKHEPQAFVKTYKTEQQQMQNSSLVQVEDYCGRERTVGD